MSLEQIESTILALPESERRAFAKWFYNHEDEIVGDLDARLRADDEAEVMRRIDEMRRNPSLAVPVTDEWFADLKRRVANAPGKASAV